MIAPGFIDLQINGGWGHDFTSDPTSIGEVAGRLPETGVTAFLPTIVTCPADVRRRALWQSIADIADRYERRRLRSGCTSRGRRSHPTRPGAHDPRWIGLPDADEIDVVEPRARRGDGDAGSRSATVLCELIELARRRRRRRLGGSQRVLADRVRRRRRCRS